MNENETQPTASGTESTTVADTTKERTVGATKKKSSVGKVIASLLVVVVILLGVLYLLEKEGRSSTTIFASIIEKQRASEVVAVVNGVDIINADLDTSIQQFKQMAAVQGVDVTTPEAQNDLRKQALDVLVNTELLKQAAAERGMSVTDEEVTERLESITADIGGEEALATRMEELGIEPDRLESDVRDEILIQELLDAVFLEANIEVTEEEIAELYEGAGGEDAGLPALEEVRPQVEAQIRAGKEQEAIDAYLEELKTEAEIEIVGEEA